MELDYCFGERKEKNLIRDPARSSTNSRKSTLLLGEKFLDKGHSWVYGMGWGVGFRLGRKSFGAGCAKNENGGSCMHVFHPQTTIQQARQLADAFSYTISYQSQRVTANACKTVEERWNLLKQTGVSTNEP